MKRFFQTFFLFTLVFLTIIFSNSVFSQNTITFNYSGASEDWIIPNCVNSIEVIVAGAEGGGNQVQAGTGPGGDGAVVTATFPVNPGDVVTVVIGGAGSCGNNSGGFNGGGTGWASNNGNNNYNSCGGGGATEFQINGVTYVIAGGGGGSGGGSVTNNGGGNGGCASGVNGGNTFGQGGGGGSQTSGGFTGAPWAGTIGTPPGQPGSLGQGGNGGFWQTASSGGGGGGYYGGGAGGVDGCCTGANGGGGGGGGSSLIPAGAACVAGSNTGDGYVTINYTGGLIATADNSGPYCTGQNIELSSTGGVSYEWTGPNGFTSSLQNPTIPSSTLANAGTYQVIVNDPVCPVPDTAWTTVVVNETPTVDPIADQTVCNGSPTTTVNFNGNLGGGATYDWTNDNTGIGLAGNGTGDILSFLGTATTQNEIGTITVTPSTAFCTGDPETFTITVLMKPSLTVSNDTTVCENGMATLVAYGSGGGGGPYNYHWDHTNDLANTQYVNPTSASSYTVYAESATGCFSDPLTINISMHPPLSGTISPFDTVCPGYGTDIWATASGGIGQPYTFTWNTGSTQTGGPNYTEGVSPGNTFTYVVTVTDGCESSPYVMETEVFVAPLPVPQYEILDPLQCEPAVFHIVNTTDPSLSQYVYWLVDGDQQFFNQDTIVTDSLWNGVYDIQMIVTSYNGCVDSTTFIGALEVNAETIANFNFSPNPITMFDTDIQFNNFSSNGDNYVWSFENGSPSTSTEENPFVSFPDGVTGTYEVMLISISDLGCIDTLIRPITVYPDVIIYAPNTFTPDDDAHNDTWRVFMEGVDISDFTLYIFNRWGEIVWESHDMEVGWDGTYHGKRVESGTYTWTIEVKNVLNDQRLRYNGHVNILR